MFNKKADVIKKAFSLLSRKKRRRQIWIWAMALLGSVFELLSISMIFPLMQLILSINSEKKNGVLQTMYNLLHMKSDEELIMWIIGILIILYIVKNIYMIVENWCINRNSYSIREEMVRKLIHQYLRLPYAFYANHNTAELQRNLTTNVSGLCLFFQYFMQIILESLVCLLISFYLIYLNPFLTIIAVVLLMSVGACYYMWSKKKLYEIGCRNQNNSKSILQWIGQTIGGMKEIKVLGREKFFEEKLGNISHCMKIDETNYTTITQIPRYITECVCITGVLIAILIQVKLQKDMGGLVAQMAAFGVAAFRLLPSVGKINGLLGNIQFQIPLVNELYKEAGVCTDEQEVKTNYETAHKVYAFTEKIELKNLSFSYEGENEILSEINIIIPKNQSIAVIGCSGAGKSTLADLILGLLTCNKGSILINSVELTERNIDSWRRLFGYIPQTIFLSDDTIRNNVAFGIQEHDINEKRVWEVLKKAQLDGFVKSLPDQLDTVIGERGARISGGQRQRIGIARALYSDPEILIMDEATSALDQETEKAVMDSISSLQGYKTLIIIAHRLSTIKNCDIIYEVKEKHVRDITEEFRENDLH